MSEQHQHEQPARKKPDQVSRTMRQVLKRYDRKNQGTHKEPYIVYVPKGPEKKRQISRRQLFKAVAATVALLLGRKS